MLLLRASSSSQIRISILCFALAWVHFNGVEASVFCSRDIYGSPKYSDCQSALSAVPRENVMHYFIEQQLRTSLPKADWRSVDDPRPDPSKTKLVQVPKVWNAGTCNIALLSYVHGGTTVALSATQWSKVSAAGLLTLMTCLASHVQGGAAVVTSNSNMPSLSVFMWQDGAKFDQMMNKYMSAPFPAGIDPSQPRILQGNFSFLENTTAGLLLTGNASTS